MFPTKTYYLSGNVGDCPEGKGNKKSDVLTIRSLLNAYARKKGLTPLISSAATGVVVDDLFIERIKHFQKNIVKAAEPDGIVTKGAGTARSLRNFLRNHCYTTVAITDPKKGLITWQVEGGETKKSSVHSRSFHVPSNASGLTLGRGYDMKHRSSTDIISELTAAGIDSVTATKISLASKLKGSAARKFVIDNDLLDYEISAPVQLKLFDTLYEEYVKKAKRLATLQSLVKTYGKVDWGKLNIGIKTVLVDLGYRGDYKSSRWSSFQKHVADNDLAAFKKAMSNKANWTGVPTDRFKRRVDYLATVPAQAVKKKGDVK